jgi:hypothetical protein
MAQSIGAMYVGIPIHWGKNEINKHVTRSK